MNCFFSKLIVAAAMLFSCIVCTASTPDDLEDYTLISASISGYVFLNSEGVSYTKDSNISDIVDSEEKCAFLAESRGIYSQSFHTQDPQEVTHSSLWLDGEKRNPADSDRLVLQTVELCYAK